MREKNFLMSLIENNDLVKLFIERDIRSRYKGSILGMLWTLVNPLIMLTVYTVIFSQVFTSKWGKLEASSSSIEFAINLFAGLIIFNIFAETATRSANLISSNPNYVKKIRFPIEILGVMVTGTAFIQAGISLIILIIANFLEFGKIEYSVLTVPIIWSSYYIKILGMVWLLSTIGVFVKDLGQIVNAVVSIIMFMSPIFYPLDMLPNTLKYIVAINPLAKTIEQTRYIVTRGDVPTINSIIIELMISIVWCEICYRILRRSHRMFADRL